MSLVKIVYKSGHTETIDVEEFTVTTTGSRLTKIEWKGMTPQSPLYLAVDNIESIWEIKK